MTDLLSFGICIAIGFCMYWINQRLRNQLEAALMKSDRNYEARQNWFRRAHTAEGRLIAIEKAMRMLVEKVEAKSRPLNVPNVPTPELAPYLLTLSFTVNRTNVITAMHYGDRWASMQTLPKHYYQFDRGFLKSAAANLGDTPCSASL